MLKKKKNEPVLPKSKTCKWNAMLRKITSKYQQSEHDFDPVKLTDQDLKQAELGCWKKIQTTEWHAFAVSKELRKRNG